jgi:GTP 3',8-cyclase
MELIDSFGRKINYLRLSVTDRCNMRCRYCIPVEGVKKLHRRDILSYDELFRIARAAVDLGIEKIRITGGEPLVRKGICGFIARLSGMGGLNQLVLTTNGLRLEEMAEELKSSGVQRLNISLDSLKNDVFSTITRGGDLSRVLAGIDAAEKIGFPVKINMVVMRGVNDTEVVDFASLAISKPYTIRFIEYMPAIKEKNWQALIVPCQEILTRIGKRYDCIPISRSELAGPAREYLIEGGIGKIGVISPVSGHFCANCNRIRVTSTGIAKGCLFSAVETDLKPYLGVKCASGLIEALRGIVSSKPDKHKITDCHADHSAFDMSGVGG